MKKPLILGHRGARAVHLENSLQGFEYAHFLDGLHGIEFDIQMTKDAQFAVFHDDNLAQLSGRQSHLDELSLSTIRQMPIYDNQHTAHHIPSLSDMPKFLEHYRHIELEIKTHARTDHCALVSALLKILPKFSHLPISLTSFDIKILALLQSHQTTLPTGLLIKQQTDIHSVINTACQLGVARIGFYYPLITHDIVKICHRYGLAITAWTVNDIQIAKNLQDFGVDVIISDDPDSIIHAIKS